MKPLLLLFVCFNSFLFSQEKWYDAYGKETTKTVGVYYRPEPKVFKKGYWVKELYRNGKLKREGYLLNPQKNDFDGVVKTYYVSGKLMKKLRYKNGLLHGKSKDYFETGQVKKIYKYKEGKLNGVWKEYHITGKIKIKGKYRNGDKVGVWKIYYKNDDGFLGDDD